MPHLATGSGGPVLVGSLIYLHHPATGASQYTLSLALAPSIFGTFCSCTVVSSGCFLACPPELQQANPLTSGGTAASAYDVVTVPTVLVPSIASATPFFVLRGRLYDNAGGAEGRSKSQVRC